MRNFITIKNEKERKIFLNYCKKNNIKLYSGKKIIEDFVVRQFKKPGFQIFFENDCFNYLTYVTSTTYAQCSGCYNEVKFIDFLKKINLMEIE